MKSIEEINKLKAPIVAIDHSLDKYRNKVLFTAKLDKANEMLKSVKLPQSKIKE
jgi:hypothetical protein